MSWNASGTIEGTTGEDGMWGDDLTFSPPRDQLDEEPAKQADFGIDLIGRCFAEGIIDGKYSCSMNGHTGDRKSFGISFSAIS